MIGTFLKSLLGSSLTNSAGGPVKPFLYLVEFAFLALVGGLWWVYAKRESESSQFRTREAELRNKGKKSSSPSNLLADARIRTAQKPETLRLSGIRTEGKPHEILGIAQNSSELEVQRAYRDLMKQYHPDIVGRPGTREWQDAQRIAESINRAKTEMIAELQNRSTQPNNDPKRSGR